MLRHFVSYVVHALAFRELFALIGRSGYAWLLPFAGSFVVVSLFQRAVLAAWSPAYRRRGRRRVVSGWLRRRRGGGSREGRVGGDREWYRGVYLRSAHWRARRRRAVERAGRRCESCGVSGVLDVHHLSYQHLGAERDRELMVLCRACHERAEAR